jgi:hypothetical protein
MRKLASLRSIAICRAIKNWQFRHRLLVHHTIDGGRAHHSGSRYIAPADLTKDDKRKRPAAALARRA